MRRSGEKPIKDEEKNTNNSWFIYESSSLAETSLFLAVALGQLFGLLNIWQIVPIVSV